MINNELLRHAPNEHVLRLLFTLGAVGARYTLKNDLLKNALKYFAHLYTRFNARNVAHVRSTRLPALALAL